MRPITTHLRKLSTQFIISKLFVYIKITWDHVNVNQLNYL